MGWTHGLSVLAMGLHGIIPYCLFHPNGTIGWDEHMGLSVLVMGLYEIIPYCPFHPNGMIGWNGQMGLSILVMGLHGIILEEVRQPHVRCQSCDANPRLSIHFAV